MTPPTTDPARDALTRDRIRGCLLGLTVGDALGAPVRRRSLAEIRGWYGPHGITHFAPAFGGFGAVTAHSQLALWSAESMMRAAMRSDKKGICHPPSVVHHAYLRWLHTQGLPSNYPAYDPEEHDGWLVREPSLFATREPGSTTVQALQTGGFPTPEEPPNASMGAACVPRTAAVGLLALPGWNHDIALGVAATTHGHPVAHHAAAALAVMVGHLVHGHTDLRTAATHGQRAVAEVAGQAKLRGDDLLGAQLADANNALMQATGLGDGHFIGKHETGPSPASPEHVERFGKGLVAHEALAIGTYAALAHRKDFRAGVTLAVNHSGASSTTGAIAGALLGASLGEGAIPAAWRHHVELSDITLQLADDLADYIAGGRMEWDRYPGW